MRRPPPPFQPGMKIGLFGGSFNPPHRGHLLVSNRLAAMLGLDFVWWLVAPQNPLKPSVPEDNQTRIEACTKLTKRYAIYVSDEEQKLQTRYTLDTIRALQCRYRGVHFVWMMGADNLAGLHHWKGWRELMQEIPMAIYPRPDANMRAGLSPAAHCYAASRLPAHAARFLPFMQPPAWILCSGLMSRLSSKELRRTTRPSFLPKWL